MQNDTLYRECKHCPEIEKAFVQSELHHPMRQTPSIEGFSNRNNKNINRSIVSMPRSNCGAVGGT